MSPALNIEQFVAVSRPWAGEKEEGQMEKRWSKMLIKDARENGVKHGDRCPLPEVQIVR